MPRSRPPANPDLSRRGRRSRPVTIGVVLVAILAGLMWLVSKSEAQLAIAFALLFAVALDAVAAHLALGEPQLEVHNPVDGIAGQDLTYFVRMPELRRPVLVSPPGSWPTWRGRQVTVTSSQPGALTLSGPPRGVVRYLVFDLTARGPLGLFESTRRLRVWLPTPLFIGPPPMEHVIDWATIRAVRFGPTEVAPRGDDLFRGLRPYVRGDAPRAVHWPATAHHGQLMVKEADGTGILAMRVVVALTEPGTAAELAASRAAWLAEDGLRRGWLVQLVTLETIGIPPAPPPLVSPTGPLPIAAFAPPHMQTASRRVTTPRDIIRQLAVAGYGPPELEDWSGITRLVSNGGDEWI